MKFLLAMELVDEGAVAVAVVDMGDAPRQCRRWRRVQGSTPEDSRSWAVGVGSTWFEKDRLNGSLEEEGEGELAHARRSEEGTASGEEGSRKCSNLASHTHPLVGVDLVFHQWNLRSCKDCCCSSG